MYLIPCPHCGPRAQAEFTYERTTDSVVDPAGPVGTAMGTLFTRANPMGMDDEIWRHTYGCRAWLVLTRDRLTHAIAAVRTIGPEALP
ncbi:sarcosine oxidase subunit delta [Sphingomonas profundi]|uniref:sarcosine oxidase subunit delta n=1 Tax=Alterirhizorhabdus profundi TaxID=2681549 RepID=UPI0012E7819D|nr:sarcosine oxidase subunit delta [Sphingomonas profundi]